MHYTEKIQDNTSDALLKESLTPSPGIWMAIYDASYGIDQMIADGQTYTAQVDANSHTVVNIGLEYYMYLNKTSNYKYGKRHKESYCELRSKS